MTLCFHQPLSCPTRMGMVVSLVLVAGLTQRFMDWFHSYSHLAAQVELTRQLDREREEAVQGNAFKRNVLERFLDREITLADAADSFLAVDVGQPLVLAHVRSHYRGDSDLEREARCVAHLTRMKAIKPPSPAIQWDRVSAEFLQMFPDSSELDLAASNELPRTDGW